MRFSGKVFYSFHSFLAAAILLLLAVLCVYGAFLGADGASAVFNSIFAGVCWCVLGLLFFFAGAWNIVRRRIFVAMTHLGCAAVILGGLLGSARVCEWRGLSPVRAWAELQQGQSAKLGDVVMTLRSLNAEYYPVSHSMLAWRIYFEARRADGSVELTPAQNIDNLLLPVNGFVIPGREIMCEKIDWMLPDSFNMPQLIWPDDYGGWKHEPLPQKQPVNIFTSVFLQRSATVGNFYDNLRFDTDSSGNAVAVNSNDGRKNPAVSLIDTQGETHYILSPGETVRMGLFGEDGRMLMYMPANVNRGGRASPFAAIIRLRMGNNVMTGVTAAGENDREVRLSLGQLYETDSKWIAAGRPSLLFHLEQPEKQVFADCVFDGKTSMRIGVNSPVSYGGYDFGIAGYDLDGGKVEIFARRNCGLLWVWSGFCLLGVGLAGWCAAGLVRRGRAAI